jgi:predicted 3-demethylubiquinone-9 3-methyltransferase (glyoxalase superfamily)
MKTKITTFFMFNGRAEAAMSLYTSLFEDGKIDSIIHYKEGDTGEVGTVMHAIFSLNGQQFMCVDSAAKHEFSFTPSMSLFVNCDSEVEIDRLFDALSKDGKVLMAPSNYGFSEKFGWLEDQFGVSWQLNFDKG